MAELTIAAILAMDAEEVQRRLAGPSDERAKFVRIAAEAGIAEAQAVYAQMLLDGIGVEKDMLSALHWFQRAAEQDHVMAINMIGRFHDLGWGIPVDKVQALHWYKEAAERGLHWGMYNFATLLTLGEGTQQNKPFALTCQVETEQRDWWPDFCEQVLGYRPAPLAPEVYETPDEDAPWLKSG